MIKKTVYIAIGLICFYWSMKIPTLGKVFFGAIGLGIFTIAGIIGHKFLFGENYSKTWYAIIFQVIVSAVVVLGIFWLLSNWFDKGTINYEDINER